jgi:hypothetical protein
VGRRLCWSVEITGEASAKVITNRKMIPETRHSQNSVVSYFQKDQK